MRSGHRPRAVPVRWCWAGSAGTPGQSPGSRALATRSARGATHQPRASSPRRQALDRWFQLMDVTSRFSAVLRMRRIPSVGRSASANSDYFDLQIALRRHFPGTPRPTWVDGSRRIKGIIRLSPRRWLGIKLRVDDSEAHASRALTTFDSRVMLVRRWSRPWNL